MLKSRYRDSLTLTSVEDFDLYAPGTFLELNLSLETDFNEARCLVGVKVAERQFVADRQTYN